MPSLSKSWVSRHGPLEFHYRKEARRTCHGPKTVVTHIRHQRPNLLTLNLRLDIIDCVRGFHFKRDGLARECLDKDLHGGGLSVGIINDCMLKY